MAGFVRQSKFRHVFSQEPKKENTYEGFRVTNCAFEGSFIAANNKLIAFCVETGGSGAFCCIPVTKTGRLDSNLPKVSAHKEYILDMQWNPFNDNMLATCSEDGTIVIWNISELGVLVNSSSDNDNTALLNLEYHERRCVQLAWHPTAANVLMSVSQEPKICIWNLDEGTVEVEINDLPQTVYNAAWSADGTRIATTSKDKKIRIYDARTGDKLVEGPGHEGSKPSRVIFVMKDEYLFSCGFSKMSERQYAVWKISGSTLEQVADGELDTANGCLIPYYDPDCNMVYIAAKGDSVIRYYEFQNEAPFIHYLTTHQGKDAQRGLAPILKRHVDVNTNEIFKFYKMTTVKNKGTILPMSFTVPRKSDVFQEDLYPQAVSGEAPLSASEWFEGKNAEPLRMDMSQNFLGKVRPKPGGGGGLKKGGLKGLKAKKEAKDAGKAEPTPAKSDPSAVPKESTSSAKSSPEPVKSSSVASAGAGVDPKVLEDLRSEVAALKANEKKMQKDYDKLSADLKLLCEAVKKNDERVATLESLVQEESENED